MNGWYLIAAPAWLILAVTAAARLSDMRRDQWSIPEHVRRLGLIGVGVMAVVMLASPFTADTWWYAPPTWRNTTLGWSWCLVWLTTPAMPPWWDFILGVHRKTEDWAGQGLRARMRGEFQALRDSFCPKCAERRRQRLAAAAAEAAAIAEHGERRANPRSSGEPGEDFPRPD